MSVSVRAKVVRGTRTRAHPAPHAPPPPPPPPTAQLSTASRAESVRRSMTALSRSAAARSPPRRACGSTPGPYAPSGVLPSGAGYSRCSGVGGACRCSRRYKRASRAGIAHPLHGEEGGCVGAGLRVCGDARGGGLPGSAPQLHAAWQRPRRPLAACSGLRPKPAASPGPCPTPTACRTPGRGTDRAPAPTAAAARGAWLSGARASGPQERLGWAAAPTGSSRLLRA